MRIRDWSSDVFSSDLVSVAVSIADTDDAGVQDILQKAYESRQLRGRRLLMAKRLIESRRRRGKGLRGSYHRTGLVTSDALLRADRKSVVSGMSVSVCVDLGGRRMITTTNIN